MNKIDLKIFIFFLSGTIMVGHALRMIYQGVFHPSSYYQPGIFDIFFDWTTLLILGFIIFGFAISLFYSNMKSKQKLDPIIH